MEISNTEIFNLIKNQDFDKIYDLIKNKKIINFDFKDNNYNYFIQYIINFNQYKILELIYNLLEESKINIRFDILDTDGRTILYNCIKYNYINLMKILLKLNKNNIGISIIDISDRLGLSALHYAVIYNNFEAFEILIENDADPYIISKDGSNVFIICLIYLRNSMIEYLINKKYNIDFLNSNGETFLQLAIRYKNNFIIDILLNMNINLNNKSNDFGLTALHQSILFDNYELYIKLLTKNININLTDYYGNTLLHYILEYQKIKYLKSIINFNELNFNLSNINGDIPLHLLLDIINNHNINITILNKFISESDLNIQNNQGITCLVKIVNNNLLHFFKNILITKPLNFFIEDNSNNMLKLTDEILDILVESYYNQLQYNQEELTVDWEIWCSNNNIKNTKNYEKLKKLPEAQNLNTYDEICKKKIRNIIIKEKRSQPLIQKINLIFDNGIFTNFCYYTGTPIDVLFGLILLKKKFISNGLNIILDYPLTINIPLDNYYSKIGLNNPYKLDFNNIEIIWAYQKIFYPSYFENELKKKIINDKYIVIPIGITIAGVADSHANIIFWDIKNKTIERFEPFGSNFPTGLNYNPELLDNLLINKFKQFDSEITYYPPYDFLPNIGFQNLENAETEKCKKLGDPNGFCAVWCIWWVYQRMLNIENSKLKIKNIANELINYIKFDNQNFKTIIRNFSNKITEIRDTFLKKFKIDINDWIVKNYSEELLNNMEKDIFNDINI